MNSLRRRLSGLVSLLLVSLGVLVVGQSGPASADAVGTGGVFVPVPYARVFNTDSPSTKLAANETRSIQIAGQYGVPSTGVGAVLVDIAATSATDAETFAWLWPNGQARPSAPVIRFGTDTVPRSNTVALALGSDGKLALQNYQGTSGFNIDIQGYFTAAGASGPAPGGFVPLTPARVLDTKNGVAVPVGQLAGGSTTTVQLGGTGGIPVGAKAIFASIEVSYVNSDGNLRIRAAGDTATTLPAFEYSTGAAERSGASIALSTDGKIEIKNLGTQDVHLKIDVMGYFAGGATEGGGFTVSTQTTLFDSTLTTKLNPGEARTFTAGGAANVPTYGASGVMATVTAFGWNASGGLELYGSGVGSEQNLDSLYFSTADTSSVSATTVAATGDNGNITIVNHSTGTVHARVFLQGWFSSVRDVPVGDEAAYRAAAAAAGITQTRIEQGIYLGAGRTYVLGVMASRSAAGTATSGEKQYLVSAGLGNVVVDGSGEADGTDELFESTDIPGTTTLEESPSLDPYPDGFTPMSIPSGSRVAASATASCREGSVHRKYAASKHATTLLGFTAYDYHHRVEYCTKGGRVTKWLVRYDWFTNMASTFRVVGGPDPNTASTLPVTGYAFSHKGRQVENCIIKYGCVATFHPWLKLFVNGIGGKYSRGSEG